MQQLKDTKTLGIIGLVVGAIIIAVLAFFVFKPNNTVTQPETDETPVRRKITQPVNEIPLAERPYVRLIPKADGRNLTISVVDEKKSATAAEFELEYQAGTLLQGAFGLVELASLPASADIMFGSCSAGGACTYHTDIKGGSLVLKFQAEQPYALKQDWRYFELANADTEIASKDAKFQLTAAGLGRQRIMVVYNTPGYPGADSDLPGMLQSDVYTIAGTAALQGEATVQLRANEAGDLQIIGYDGTKWQTFDTTVSEKTASATAPLMQAYAVVGK